MYKQVKPDFVLLQHEPENAGVSATGTPKITQD